ncbi:unnamed protein product, partial [Ixodes persulcatus]
VSLLYSKNKRKSFTFLEHSETIHRTYTLGVLASPHLFPNGLCLWCRQKYRENRRPSARAATCWRKKPQIKSKLSNEMGTKFRHVTSHFIRSRRSQCLHQTC